MKFGEYQHYYSDECDDVLISLKEVAEKHSLDYVTLMARLERGCPLLVAAQLPEKWEIMSMFEDENGELIFGISKKTHYYREKELLRYLNR